jgi:hypothetical protein
MFQRSVPAPVQPTERLSYGPRTLPYSLNDGTTHGNDQKRSMGLLSWHLLFEWLVTFGSATGVVG